MSQKYNNLVFLKIEMVSETGLVSNLEKAVLLAVAVILALPVAVYAQTPQPISGASVVAFGDAGYGVAETDAEGFFEITEGLGEGVYDVRISAKGYISKVIQDVEVVAGEEVDIGDVFLKPSAVIKGVVETPDGEPAANVPVALKDSSGNVLQLTTTSSDGSFVFDTDVRNGTYTVEAYAFMFEGMEYQTVTMGFTQVKIPVPKPGASYLEGYTSGRVENVEAVQGETIEGIVIRLGVSGIISGRVTDDQGNPVADVLVVAFSPGGGIFQGFYAVTDEDGRYRIANNLDTGDYNVTLLFPKGYVWNFMNAKKVHVVAGEETANVDFQLERSGIISGVVVYSDDTPAANASVVAFSQDGKYFGFTTSDIDGSFRIDSGLGTATYQVMAFVGTTAFSQPVTVQVTAGEETKDVKLVVTGTAKGMAAIEGTVTDIDGNPLVDVEVSALDAVTHTDEDGSYKLIVALPQGVTSTTVTVSASKRGYETVVKEGVTVTVGETTKPVDFTLEKLKVGVIKGRVLARAPPPSAKKTASLSISLSSQTVSIGESVTISGAITPSLTGEVSILVASDTVFEEVAKVTLEDGSFSYSFTPTAKGVYRIKVSWPGNDEYNPAESEILTLTVVKKTAELSISLSSSTITIGDSVTIEGTITPSVTGKVFILLTPDGKFKKIAEVDLENGSFSFTLKPEALGTYRVKVVWPGNPEYKPAESSVLTLTVKKVSPTVEISVSKTTANVGETVTISGSISPFKAETDVVITVTSPSGISEYTVTSSDGSFEYSIELDAQGTWSVKAEVPEGPVYEPAESNEVQITVQEKKCIIATVTFGSEVAPEVNFLRSFRDGLILMTYAGRQFYVAFDAFYYSWSTPVAKFIESNPVLKPVVKAILYPLLGILKLTALSTTPLFGANPEAAAVLAGFIASSLIGVVYVSPVLIAASLLTKRRGKTLKPSREFVKALWTLVAASLVFIGLGLALENGLLLTAATSAYVLSTIASSSTSILHLATTKTKEN